LPFFVQPPFSWISGFIYILYDTALILFVVRQLRIYLARPREALVLRKLSLTVLIPSRNEGLHLLRCLRAVLSQTLPATEIIIIDDGSSDHSFQALEAEVRALGRSVSDTSVSVIRKKHSGKARSLNEALASVTTDLVLTIDADTFLEKEALEKLIEAFSRNPNLKAAGGVLNPVAGLSTIQAKLFQTFQKFEYIRAFLSRQAYENLGALLLVSGAFAIYDTETLKAVGGYDATSLVEDYELIHRIYRYAYDAGIPVAIASVPEARATTDCPATVTQFLKQRQRWFGGFLQTLFRYRQMIGSTRYGSVGTFMLPLKTLDTLQPIYGLTALAVLITILFRGQFAPVVLWFLIGKLLIDYVYHFYALVLYNRWQKRKVPKSFWIESVAITLFEPIFFQPLRHFGALLGWFVFLRKRHNWTPSD
jgi:cellulose synthase/poly-beta-1,6-N-acetylglucosamine synthase-like glycosyltransferase